MGLFKGFFCYLYLRYEKNSGLFGVAVIFLGLIVLFFFGLYLLMLSQFANTKFDVLSGISNNSLSFKLYGAIVCLILAIPIWLFFKKIKKPFLEEFENLDDQTKGQVLLKSKRIFRAFFVYLVFCFFTSVLIRVSS